jgi:hypothetical protein
MFHIIAEKARRAGNQFVLDTIDDDPAQVESSIFPGSTSFPLKINDLGAPPASAPRNFEQNNARIRR